MNPEQRKARWAIAGRLLMQDIHPGICRIFDPDTVDRTLHHLTVVHATLNRTVFPPCLAQLVNHRAWTPESVLRTTIWHTMEKEPDADPRSHLVGGYVLMTLMPFWNHGRRLEVCSLIEFSLAMTRDDEVAASLPRIREQMLGAYDAALAMVAAGDSTTSTPPEEGAA